jgi:hypothetical protein
VLCRVFWKFVRECFVLQALRFEGEGYGHTRKGRNISAILEFICILVQAMEIVTTRSDSNIQFMLKMVRALQGFVT